MKTFALLATLVLSFAPVQLSAQDQARSLAAELVPSHQALLRKRARELEDKLEHALTPLVGRSRAVHVTLPDGSRTAIDEPVAAPYVVVTFDSSAAQVNDQDVVKLVRGIAPELSRAHLSVIASRPPKVLAKAPPLERVGPFAVSHDSAPWLRVALALMLLSNVLLAAMLLTRRFRRPA